MPKVKTITLDGTETAVKFEKGYPYYVITNMGDGELYASGSPGITAYADGVYTILPGMETRISPELSADTVYLLGSGTVQVRAEEIAVPTSFNPAGKGGGSGGTTDYTQLENKPSINSVDLIGNKTLEELGINNFDGKYINLSGAPVKCTVINNVSSGWVRFCIIEKAPVSGTMIINVSRQNRTAANNGEAFSFMGVLSYNLCNSRKEASFKILNACGIGSEIPTTRVIVPDNPEWRNIYIDFLTDSIYGLPVNCEMFFDPEMFKNSTITFPMTQYPPSIDTVNHKHYTFENKVKEISVDTALSETSTNPVQNKVVAAALDTKEDKPYLIPESLSLIGKTVAEAKQYILDWFLEQQSNKSNGVLRINTSLLMDHWNDDDYILPAGALIQISILNIYDSDFYGDLLFDRFGGDLHVGSINNGAFVSFSKIYTSKDITPEMIEKLSNL